MIIYTIIILSTVVMISLSLIRLLLPKFLIVRESVYSAMALYAADSAMEWCLFEQRGGPSADNVEWQNLINTSPVGSTISKTGGIDGVWDAGASSVQSIASGDGYIQFIVPENNANLLVGLSDTDSNEFPGDMLYVLSLTDYGEVAIHENGGAFQTVIGPYSAGDVFRIAVSAGGVRYYKNGNLIPYVSKLPFDQAFYPLVFDTSFWTLDASITNATIFEAYISVDSLTMSNGTDFKIYNGNALIDNCNTVQNLNYRTVGNYKGISRSLEVF